MGGKQRCCGASPRAACFGGTHPRIRPTLPTAPVLEKDRMRRAVYCLAVCIAMLGTACQSVIPGRSCQIRSQFVVAHQDDDRVRIDLTTKQVFYERFDGKQGELDYSFLRRVDDPDNSFLAIFISHDAMHVQIDDRACIGALTTKLLKVASPEVIASSERLAQRYRADREAGWSDMAVADLREGAELGLVWAQTALGLAYRNGDGVSQDNGLAMHWLEYAASQNEPEAMYQLSGIYAQGQAGKIKQMRALDLMQDAARQQHPKAKLFMEAGRHRGLQAVDGEGRPPSSSGVR
ncbi:MAG: tetratricopeptide repeat protein [Lysobacterales bacterium]